MSFRICSIGCGRHARNAHGTSYARYVQMHADTELAACCDLDSDKAQAFARDYGFGSFDTDLDVMLLREKPDAVCLIAPPSLACDLACRVLKHRIPMLTEKPPAMNVAELHRMIDAANDTPTMVAFNRRFAPALVDLRQNMDGLVVYDIDYLMVRAARDEPDFSMTAIHGIDTLRYLGGDFADLRITYQPIESAPPAVNMLIEGVNAAGVRMRLRIYPCAGGIFERAAVQAEGQTLEANVPMWASHDMPGVFRKYAHDTLVTETLGNAADPEIVVSGFYGENAAFFDNVRSGLALSPDLISSRQSVEIADAIRRRAERLDEE